NRNRDDCSGDRRRGARRIYFSRRGFRGYGAGPSWSRSRCVDRFDIGRRIGMDRTKAFGFTLALALTASGCRPKQKPIIVGSKNFTEQVVIGEIVAQHLEHRLGRPVQRRLNLGGTLLTYQSLLNGEITLYPEYTGTIEAEILKEQAASDPAQV